MRDVSPENDSTALLSPMSAYAFANPKTTLIIAANPKSTGDSFRASTASCANCSSVATAADMALQYNARDARWLKFIGVQLVQPKAPRPRLGLSR